ncbi:MAG TPA: MFS transporter [Candidatus Sulfotelmatobacter sp.]|jgi:predicted MFS family arabinose efflux permease|nr:MFS transporter [Candidatus Sulfotelmatobacter sp.]
MQTSTLHKIFKAFQYRDFRLMWIGACTSSVGTWMQIVAQGWLIYRLSHSAFLLALDQFLAGIPIFLFTLIGGVVADRTERRKILLMSQWLQMASAGTLTVLVIMGLTHVWPILCLSFVSGFAQAFGGPAYSALIPTLVDREDMPNAIALNSIQFNLAVTVGPALAGVTLAHLGEKWCFGLNAVSFMAPIISLSIISARFLPQKSTETIFNSLKQGIRFIRQQGAMEALIVLAFLMTFLSMPMRTYLPVFVKDIFQRGPETYGNLLSLMGVGSICGSLGMAAMGNFSKKGRFSLLMLICLGAGISVFSLSHSLRVDYVTLIIVGASMMAVFATVTSLVQLIVTNEMRGRVMSVYNCAFRGGMPMGNLVSGWLVPAFTAPLVLGVNGFLLVIVAVYFLVVQRRVAAL